MIPKLNLKICYSHTLFYTVDNFSLWDVHCRKHLKEVLPEFYKTVEQDLVEYSAVRQKYGWAKNIEKYFLHNALANAEKKIKVLPRQDVKIILTPIKKLDHKFRDYWQTNLPFLEAYSKIIQVMWAKFAKEVCAHCEDFFEISFPKKINVFIVMSERGLGGGENLTGKGVTLEIGSLNVTPANVFDELIHEIIHFISAKKTDELLKNHGVVDVGTVREAITHLLAPHGFLSQKLKFKSIPQDQILKRQLIDNYKQKIYSAVLARFNDRAENYEYFIKEISNIINN